MRKYKPPPPHLHLRSLSGEPLYEAFEAALSCRLERSESSSRLGRMRRKSMEHERGDVADLRDRLKSPQMQWLEPAKVHIVPYMPLEKERPLAIVVCRKGRPADGIFLMRGSNRWMRRSYLRKVVERLDPEGTFLEMVPDADSTHE